MRFSEESRYRFQISDLGEDVYHLRVDGGPWADSRSLWIPHTDALHCSSSPGSFYITLADKGLTAGVRGEQEKVLLESEPGAFFGVSRNKWMFCFRYDEDFQFFGQGEKNNGFEKTGKKNEVLEYGCME